MKCYICDRDLAQDEIKLHPIMKKWEPCGTCLEAIKDAFEPDSEEEIEEALNNSTVEALYEMPSEIDFT